MRAINAINAIKAFKALKKPLTRNQKLETRN